MSSQPPQMKSLNYIGSKRTLFNFIETTILDVLKDYEINNFTFSDLFAGTGIIGFGMSKHFRHTISNDLEYYSFIINKGLLECIYTSELENIIKELNHISNDNEQFGNNLILTNYSGERMFFTEDNARRIDVIRTKIEDYKYNANNYYFLLASLLTSCDKVANTTSVYGAFLKKFKTSSIKTLVLEPIHTNKIKINSKVYCKNILDVINDKEDMDIVYLDPPYNKRQYSANYSPLNYIALYDSNIKIKGKTGLIEGYNKSEFCQIKNIEDTFNKLLSKLRENKTKYIFLSYNNEGLLSEEKMKKLLEKYGEVQLKIQEYKKYKSSKENIKNNVNEYLWCIKIY